jgi:hypothetical protein
MELGNLIIWSNDKKEETNREKRRKRKQQRREGNRKTKAYINKQGKKKKFWEMTEKRKHKTVPPGFHNSLPQEEYNFTYFAAAHSASEMTFTYLTISTTNVFYVTNWRA